MGRPLLFGQKNNNATSLIISSRSLAKSNKKQDMTWRPKGLNNSAPTNRRGRPDKPPKVNDAPENVARVLFGLPPVRTGKK